MEALAPFYHHLQHAGRTTLGEYLLSWATSFHAHFDRIAQADARLDLAPPPNCGREIVVELINRMGRRMGFSRVARLWQECFITEEHFAEPFFVLVQIAVGLGRLAEDLRLWMTAEFDFFELADEHASGSSGRPQKKNPFGLQAVINGAAIGAGRLAAQLATNITVSEEGDTTYHAYSMYQYAHDVVAWTEFMADVIEKGEFKLAELERKSALGYAGAREALDVLVYEHKVPYRFRAPLPGRACAHGRRRRRPRDARGDAQGTAAAAAIDADELVRTMTGRIQGPHHAQRQSLPRGAPGPAREPAQDHRKNDGQPGRCRDRASDGRGQPRDRVMTLRTVLWCGVFAERPRAQEPAVARPRRLT